MKAFLMLVFTLAAGLLSGWYLSDFFSDMNPLIVKLEKDLSVICPHSPNKTCFIPSGTTLYDIGPDKKSGHNYKIILRKEGPKLQSHSSKKKWLVAPLIAL